jgi:hypothetical protein
MRRHLRSVPLDGSLEATRRRICGQPSRLLRYLKVPTYIVAEMEARIRALVTLLALSGALVIAGCSGGR